MSTNLDLDGAKIFKRGVYLSCKKDMSPAEYVVEVVSLEQMKRSQKSSEMVTLTVKVLESGDPDQHPVGAERIWQQDMVDETIAGPNLAAMTAAILGIDTNDDEKVKEAQAAGKLTKAYILGRDKKAFVGRKVKMAYRPHTTKPKNGTNGVVIPGKLISLCNFRPA